MAADAETNFVYVSDLLAGRFPSVVEGLERILPEHGIGLGMLHGTKDIWIRDNAPIQVDRDGSFVLFRYLPDYLKHGHRHLITEARPIVLGLPGVRSCEFSDIVLDGGNVVRNHDKAILTDKVFRENRGMCRLELKRELRRLLRVGELIVIPTEPGDVVGHADGILRFVESGTVLLNDYRRVDRAYRRRLREELATVGSNIIEIVYRPDLASGGDIPSAVGNYVNFLEVGDLLVVPTYDMAEDHVAQETLSRSFPTKSIRTLPCRALAEEGGVLNCVTWVCRLASDPLG